MTRKKLAMAAAMAIAIGGGVAGNANASGIPVVDVANLQQSIAQYMQLGKQLAQLEAQLGQAQQQYASMTGSRGMENLLAGTNRNTIPTNWRETLDMMGGGSYSKISGTAKAIKDQVAMIDPDYIDSLNANAKHFYDASANSAASHQALAGTVYDDASARFDRLTSLMDAIPAATDMKAISDLQARIQVEQVMLQNEQIKFSALAEVAKAQEAQERRQIRDMLLDSNSGTSVGKPPGFVKPQN